MALEAREGEADDGKFTSRRPINGDATSSSARPTRPLLDVLRDRLGLTGTKEGCGTGDCGACSVTVDGRLVCSCLVLGAEAEGREIGTIEGMAKGETLHPLQQKFLEHAALQCGICTPGFLVAPRRCSSATPTRPRPRSATGSPAISAAAPATTRSSRAVHGRGREMTRSRLRHTMPQDARTRKFKSSARARCAPTASTR